jgi:hypothetical protein
MKLLSKIYLSNQKLLVERVVNFFTAKVLHPSFYQEILEWRQKNAQSAMAGKFHACGRDMPSFRILAISDVRANPSLAAAPFGPPMTQLVEARA